jgi:hypothetical protein
MEIVATHFGLSHRIRVSLDLVCRKFEADERRLDDRNPTF